MLRLGGFEYLGSNLGHHRQDGLGLTLTSYAAAQSQPWHHHENPTVFLLLRGEFLDESREHGRRILDRPMLLVHPAEVLHTGKAGPHGRVGLNIEPTAAWLARYDLTHALTNYRFLDCPTVTVEALRLTLAALHDDPSIHTVLEDEVVSLLTKIDDHECEFRQESPVWRDRLYEFVAESDLAECNLRSAANALCVHPVYLARQFRRLFGCTIGQFALYRRIVATARHVIHDDQALGMAAYSAGFADQAQLSRLFKREFGHKAKSLLAIRERCKV